MNKALSYKNLYVSYENTTPALTDVSFDIGEGEFWGIMGPNGGGKSTLLKATLGIIPFQSGEIEIFGKPIKQNKLPIGYVPQQSSVDRRFPISVLDVVKMGILKRGLHPFFRYSKQHSEFAYSQLERVGIEKLAARQIQELSGGEFQRMLIARALAVQPKILFLDEPTASVDPASREQIYEVLSTFKKDVTIVMVTHDLSAISSEVDNIACLSEKLIYSGEPVLSATIMRELYGCAIDLGVTKNKTHTNEGMVL